MMMTKLLYGAVVCLACLGCQQQARVQQGEMAQADIVSPGAVSVCTSCGQFKGTAECCQPGTAKCAGCGLDKGSPGCCKLDMLDS